MNFIHYCFSISQFVLLREDDTICAFYGKSALFSAEWKRLQAKRGQILALLGDF